jgi:hypothetical protein
LHPRRSRRIRRSERLGPWLLTITVRIVRQKQKVANKGERHVESGDRRMNSRRWIYAFGLSHYAHPRVVVTDDSLLTLSGDAARRIWFLSARQAGPAILCGTRQHSLAELENRVVAPAEHIRGLALGKQRLLFQPNLE